MVPLFQPELENGLVQNCNSSALAMEYPQTSNIRCIIAGNKIVDHSDGIGASPVGAAPTTSSFST